MDVSKLKKGQEIKNYPRLCELIGEKQKGGKGKQYQLRELERYVFYHKEGRSFVIDKIYDEPKPKIDGRGKSEGSKKGRKADYVEAIQVLILHLVDTAIERGEAEGQGVSLSKNSLFELLKMVNQNYRYCKDRQQYFSECYDITEKTTEECFAVTDRMLKSNLESALNALTRQKVITWKNEYRIAEIKGSYESLSIRTYIDETNVKQSVIVNELGEIMKYDIRTATDNEESIIIGIEAKVMKEMAKKYNIDIEDNPEWYPKMKQILYRIKKFDEFYDRVTKEIIQLGYGFYCKSYRIVFNKDNLDFAIGCYHLTKEETNMYEEIVNKGVQNRFRLNSENRQDRIGDEFQFGFHPVYGHRQSELYLLNVDKYLGLVVDKDTEDIKEELINFVEESKKDE